ncbi:unnamed protein product [Dicrocoelium dendriticum]|nr:unnamed protein product [Dicrocoelium dendriticum]
MFIIRLAAEALALTDKHYDCPGNIELSDLNADEPNIEAGDNNVKERTPEPDCQLSRERLEEIRDSSKADELSLRTNRVQVTPNNTDARAVNVTEEKDSILFSILSGREDVRTACLRSELYLCFTTHSTWFNEAETSCEQRQPLHLLRPKFRTNIPGSKRTYDNRSNVEVASIHTEKQYTCSVAGSKVKEQRVSRSQHRYQVHGPGVKIVPTDQPLDLSSSSNKKLRVAKSYKERTRRTKSSRLKRITSCQRKQGPNFHTDSALPKDISGKCSESISNDGAILDRYSCSGQRLDLGSLNPSSRRSNCIANSLKTQVDFNTTLRSRFADSFPFPLSLAASMSIVAALSPSVGSRNNGQSTTASPVLPPMGSDPLIASRLLQLLTQRLNHDKALAQMHLHPSKLSTQSLVPTNLAFDNIKDAQDFDTRSGCCQRTSFTQLTDTPYADGGMVTGNAEHMMSSLPLADVSKYGSTIDTKTKFVSTLDMQFREFYNIFSNLNYHLSRIHNGARSVLQIPSVAQRLSCAFNNSATAHGNVLPSNTTFNPSTDFKSYLGELQTQLSSECLNMPNSYLIAHSLLRRLTRLIKCPESTLLKCLDHLSHRPFSDESATATRQHTFVRLLSSTLLHLTQCPLEERLDCFKANWHQAMALCGEDCPGKLILLLRNRLAQIAICSQRSRLEEREKGIQRKEIRCQEVELTLHRTAEFGKTLKQLERLRVAFDRARMTFPACLLVCVTFLLRGSHRTKIEHETTLSMERCIVDYLNTRYADGECATHDNARVTMLSNALETLQKLNKETMRGLFTGLLPEPVEVMLERSVWNR